MILTAASFLVLSLPMVHSKAPSPEFSDVFVEGEGGYANIRIPSVVVSKKNTVLAFAEGRDGRASDQAKNKIILKRSLDQGRTWKPMQVVADDGPNSLNNPCAIVEQSTGRILLMYQRIPGHLSEGSKGIEDGYDGPNVYRSFLTSSDDDGATWSTPADITKSAKHPGAVKTICSGPGIGIQLTQGKFKGRLVVPFNEGPFWMWNNYAVFSDDKGITWKAGQNAPGALIADSKGKMRSQINEVQMVELKDGSVMLCSRQFAGARVRKGALSHDGGETWSPIFDIPEIKDPSCMGSILRYSYPQRRQTGVILYSGPDSTERKNGTIYASHDEAKSWPIKRVLTPGAFAYSVLTRFPDGTVGCLFETDDYRKISFARFDLSWVTGADSIVEIRNR